MDETVRQGSQKHVNAGFMDTTGGGASVATVILIAWYAKCYTPDVS